MNTMTPDEFNRRYGPRASSKSKYGAVKTEYAGVRYDSRGEARRAESLDMLVAAGECLDWVRQPKVALGVPELTYRPDFLVIPARGKPWYEDFKGAETPEFRKNARLWARYGRLELRVVRASGRGFEIARVITPGADG